MVHIVTGKINSGKTTFLQEQYRKNHDGDGVLSLKIMQNRDIVGYDVYYLGLGKKKRLMMHERHYFGEFAKVGKIGPYVYDDDRFKRTVLYLQRLIDNNVSPIYLDEVGMLEINGGGFDGIIKQLVESTNEVFLSARSDLVPLIISRYQLTNYDVMEL